MRTLNRPMFRYGGPIKEGVMNGIREPKRNGGSMANNEGPRRAALVGNPIYPQGSDGRTRHVVPAILGAASLAGRFIAPAFGRYVMRNVPKLYKTGKNVGKQIGKQTTKVEGFNPNAVGRFFANDPLASKAVTGAGFTGKAIQKVGSGIKYGTTTPSGLLFLGAPVTYMAGKYFLGDGTEIKGKDLNKITQGGKKPGENSDMYYKAPEKELTEAEKSKIESDNRIKQMDKYREIMDIKGMSKDAAYKSLIDAGKIIQEGGNLKEQLKSGKLIQNLTQAASKRFDKVGDTEAALRSLIVKGEIDKEMNKEDKALTRQLKKTQLKLAEKGLAGDSFEEAILKSITGQQGKMPTGSKLAGILKATRGIDSVVLDGSGMSKPGDEIKFLETQVSEGIEKGNVINPGAYVINSKILIIDENNNVTQYY